MLSLQQKNKRCTNEVSFQIGTQLTFIDSTSQSLPGLGGQDAPRVKLLEAAVNRVTSNWIEQAWFSFLLHTFQHGIGYIRRTENTGKTGI